MQNKKGPATAEPKICQQKRKWGSWFIVECFRPFDRLRDLVYTLLFTALCDDFTQSYCARRRESRASLLAHDRAEKQAAEGCNPLYIVEYFRSDEIL